MSQATCVNEACTANVPPDPHPVPPYRTWGGQILTLHRDYVAGYTVLGSPRRIFCRYIPNAGATQFVLMGGDKT